MTEHVVDPAHEPRTRAFCPWCGEAADTGAAYCGECGGALNSDLAEQPSNGAPDAGSPAAPPGQTDFYSPEELPTAGYPFAYPLPPPPQRNHTGLIVGLSAVGLVAVGAIVAVVLLASSGGSSAPPLSATTPVSSPRITPVAPSGGGSGSSGFHARTRHRGFPRVSAAVPATPHSTVTPSAPVSPAVAQQVTSVIQEYWTLIGESKFGQAYARYDPNTVSTSRSSWVAAERVYKPIQVTVFSSGTSSVSGTSATVSGVSVQTVDPIKGCQLWSGSYTMQELNGSWYIDQSNINPTGC